MKSPFRTIGLIGFALATACDGRSATTPTPSEPSSAQPLPPSPPSPPSPPPSNGPRQPQAFEISGVVRDDGGTPIPGATLTILLNIYDVGPVAMTNASGSYQVDFSGVPGSNYYPEGDASGTRESVAFLQVEAPGFERFARHVLGTTSQLVENVRLHRVRRISSGESLVLTIAPDDSVCATDSWPGREQVCGIVRVLATGDGVMTIEAIPTDAGLARPDLTVYGGDTGAPRANPTSLRVVAGTEYFLNVPVELSFAENRTFLVKTSLITR
jgi:hypothetical protein